MYIVFLVLHVLICLGLCGVVLLQSGKGGGLAGAFGGGGGLPQQMFGSRAVTTALNKMTIYLAVGFFVTSAVLFILSAGTVAPQGSAVQKALEDGELTTEQPVAPPSDDVFAEPAAGDRTDAAAGGEQDQQ